MHAQAENQQILNLLPIPIAILNGEQHHIIFANDAMFEFWRRDRSDQTIGQPLVAAFPEVNPTFLGQLKQVLQMGITYKDEEVLMTLNDQQGNPYSIYIDYTYQPIANEHAKVTGRSVIKIQPRNLAGIPYENAGALYGFSKNFIAPFNNSIWLFIPFVLVIFLGPVLIIATMNPYLIAIMAPTDLSVP